MRNEEQLSKIVFCPSSLLPPQHHFNQFPNPRDIHIMHTSPSSLCSYLIVPIYNDKQKGLVTGDMGPHGSIDLFVAALEE